MKQVLAGLLLALVAAVTLGAEVQVPLPGRDGLVLTMPDAWQHRASRATADAPPTVVMRPTHVRDFTILVTPIWSVTGPPTREALRKLVEDAIDFARPKAVETRLPLIEFTGPGDPKPVTDQALQMLRTMRRAPR
jgi:hypothetical protein